MSYMVNLFQGFAAFICFILFHNIYLSDAVSTNQQIEDVNLDSEN